MKIIGYTYEADAHCPACTKERFVFRSLTVCQSPLDEHDIPYKSIDREGNLIHPMFSTDEYEFEVYGDCRQELQ